MKLNIEKIKIRNALLASFKLIKEGDKITGFSKVRKVRSCIKCGDTGHTVRHHITYKPYKAARLCTLCHSRITAINTVGAIVTNTSKKTPETNNEIRLILWDWFLSQNGVITMRTVAKVLGKDFIFTEEQIAFVNRARLHVLNYRKAV